jgi:hypothetical protein
MAMTIVMHLNDGEPIKGEVDALPEPTDSYLTISNPRKIDGKDLHFIAMGVTQVIWPFHVVSFIEIMPSDDSDQIIGFVRE